MSFESGLGSWTLVFALWNFELCALHFDFRLANADTWKSKVQSSKYKNQRPKTKDLSQQKMQRCFAQANLIPAVQDSWLARREPDGIVNHSAVD
jgi:hypothetical protein